jgi:hypothetical protein
MAYLPRPRFYALMWVQALAAIVIGAGMAFYWAKFWNKVPATVSYRVIAIMVIIALTVAIPLIANSNAIRSLANDEVDAQEKIADKVNRVRGFLWGYSYLNLILVTYLVHITGGIAGSMFAGLYVTLPSVPIILRLDSYDLKQVRWFVVCCVAAIALSFLMSHDQLYEFDAANPEFTHAYDLSITTVTLAAALVPLIEVMILNYQESKKP